jgi:hypothetical protein
MKPSPDDPKLTAYALGELPEAERAAIEAALREAPEGQRAVEAIQRGAETLRQELADEPVLDLTSAQRQALLDKTSSGSRSLWSWLFGANRPVWIPGLTLGTAAVILLIVIWPQSPALLPPRVQALPLYAQKNLFTATIPSTGVPLPLRLPAPTLKGTPEDLPSGPNVEPLTDKARPPFLAPAGVTNVALHKPVRASIAAITGELAQITDGDKEAFDDQVVELRKGLQYVQVDLQGAFRIYAIVIWNDHRYIQVYHRVIVQVADDAEFTQNARTLYNNDIENRAGLGVGTDKEYFETKEGRLIDAKGVVARHVRWYTNGSHLSALNNRTEIEVYGLPGNP